jgi:hypothetical protein
MRGQGKSSWRRSRVAVMTFGLGIGVALLVSGCGGNNKANTGGASSSPTAAATTSPSALVNGTALSGKWSGQYSGTYSGTFTLNWQQTGSDLSGSITLSSPAGTLPINGTVNGSAIQFGTVGGPGITYTGSVSGNSMSGSYQTPAGGGSWSANKTS